MTVMCAPVSTLSPVLLPVDAHERYRMLEPLTGMWIVLVSGDSSFEGRLVAVLRPSLASDQPTPNVVLDTGRARVAGPVLAGDLVAAA